MRDWITESRQEVATRMPHKTRQGGMIAYQRERPDWRSASRAVSEVR